MNGYSGGEVVKGAIPFMAATRSVSCLIFLHLFLLANNVGLRPHVDACFAAFFRLSIAERRLGEHRFGRAVAGCRGRELFQEHGSIRAFWRERM